MPADFRTIKELIMSTSPDLSLPSKCPASERWHHEDHECDKIAIYTLVDLGDDGINDLLQVLRISGLGPVVDDPLDDFPRLPPTYNFSGRSLRDVYDYHLTIDHKELLLFPTLMVVAHRPDYRKYGVLLVNLDADFECGVDFCRTKASTAIEAANNMIEVNMGWEEIKIYQLRLLSASIDDDDTDRTVTGDDASNRKVPSG